MANRRQKKPKPRLAVESEEPQEQPWSTSRAGARAGRGFRYQDVVGGALLVSIWAGRRDPASLVPEGHDDMVLEGQTATLFLQVKSRQPHLGRFPKGRIADELVAAWHRNGSRLRRDSDRLVLVVEQPYGNLGPGEHAVDGADFEEVHTSIRSNLSAGDAAKLIARSELWIWPDPQSSAITCLAGRLGLPDQVCGAHFNALRQHVGSAEDSNASATEDQRHALTPTDIDQIIDEVTSITDPSSLQEALLLGLCEAVDFLAPDDDEQFYIGTDVTPGHVAAGLPHTRVEVDHVSAALDDGRPVLVTGPSGSGKSALLWMSAYERDEVRWYRVRSCSTPAHVASLIRLARGLLPTPRTPVGFVVDNAARPGLDAWDQLVAECGMIPGVHLIGATREEDLFLVASLAESQVIRLSMAQELAEGIWHDLSERGKTDASHWLEAFGESSGLLLEYMHLLSEGTRLQDVVGSQVRTRGRENRHLELRILSITSTANAWAAEIPLNPLIAHLDESEESVSAALDRLAREHLILRREDGSISGLHALRSEAIFRAIHEQPPPTSSESACRTSSLIATTDLRNFLVGILTDLPDLRQDLLTELARQVSDDASGRRVVAILYALRTAEFIEEAHTWNEIFEAVDVPLAMRSIAGTFALVGTELSKTEQLWDPRIIEAVKRIRNRTNEAPALREEFLSRLPEEWLPSLLLVQTDCELATELLATVNDLENPPSLLLELPNLVGSPFAEALTGAGLKDVATVLSAARGASVRLAERLAVCLGGPDVLLERIRESVPWCQRIASGPPTIELLDDSVDDSFKPGDIAVRIEYRFISDRLTPDPHGTVIELSKMAFACHPRAEVVRAVALDARDRPYAIRNLELASKRLRRRVLPPANEIAWNRLRQRVVNQTVAADTLTERAVSELRLAEQITRLVTKVATIWLTSRGNSAGNRSMIDNARQDLLSQVDELPPLPYADRDLSGPLDQGGDGDSDMLQTVLRSCLLGLIDNLAATEPNHFRTSALLTRLITQTQDIATDGRWQIIGHRSVPNELEGLRSTLASLREISSTLANDPSWRRRATAIAKKAPRSALRRVAEASERRSCRRLEESLESIRTAVERPGIGLSVSQREDPDNGFINPRTEVLLMLEVDSLELWTQVADELVRVRQQLSEHRNVWAVPVVQDILAASFATKLGHSEGQPIDPGWDGWDTSIPRPLSDELSDAFFQIWSTAVESSAIAGYPEERIGDLESEIADITAAECQAAYDTVLNVVQENPSSMVLQEVGQIATGLVATLNAELESEPTERGALATMALDMIDGQSSELLSELTGAQILLAEHAIRPAAAEQWLERVTTAES